VRPMRKILEFIGANLFLLVSGAIWALIDHL
jgi:hypothetical protein